MIIPITNHLLPITYYQLPITNYLLPITNYLLPITYYPLPITDKPMIKRLIFALTALGISTTTTVLPTEANSSYIKMFYKGRKLIVVGIEREYVNRQPVYYVNLNLAIRQ